MNKAELARINAPVANAPGDVMNWEDANHILAIATPTPPILVSLLRRAGEAGMVLDDCIKGSTQEAGTLEIISNLNAADTVRNANRYIHEAGDWGCQIVKDTAVKVADFVEREVLLDYRKIWLDNRSPDPQQIISMLVKHKYRRVTNTLGQVLKGYSKDRCFRLVSCLDAWF